MNILITSAGRRVSLVTYFQKELKAKYGENAKVVTTDLLPKMSTACLASDESFKVGRFKDKNYINTLLDICAQNQVKIIVPTLDTELLLYSQNRTLFQTHGIEMLVSDSWFIEKCRNKNLINDFFQEKGFLVPKAVNRVNPQYPIFIKPIDGSNSKNLHLIFDEKMLSKSLLEDENAMWMEYLSPDEYSEYTVDLYYDKNSQLKCIVPRIRIAVRGGETNKGITDKNEYLMHFIKERLNTIQGVRGCVTLQLFFGKENKKVYGIEINPRFGGGYPLSYLAGANYPSWIIKEYLLQQEIAYFSDWEDKLLLLRHDNEVIVHDFEYQS